jgi:ATP-dependent Clp protease ATP-binding subunit ClpB
MPVEIDEVQRRITQMEIERQALKKETDPASRERLDKLGGLELSGMNEELSRMKAHWSREKELIQVIRRIKGEQEQLNNEAQQAEREGNLARVAEIRYGRMIELQKKLEEANRELGELQRESKMLKEEVDDEDMAEVVSRWTGIPVSKMLEGERDKLVRMEERLQRGSSGRMRRWPPCPTPCAGPARVCRTPTGPSAPSFSWAPPGWARPNWPRPWPSFSSTANRP